MPGEPIQLSWDLSSVISAIQSTRSGLAAVKAAEIEASQPAFVEAIQARERVLEAFEIMLEEECPRIESLVEDLIQTGRWEEDEIIDGHTGSAISVEEEQTS